MSSTGGRGRRRPRLTIWGWILTVAGVVLAVLAVVTESPVAIAGLIAVIFVWARLLSASLPSAQATPRSLTRDFGKEAEERHERKRNYPDWS